MAKKILITLALVLIACVLFFMRGDRTSPDTAQPANTQTYSNEGFGITFVYPNTYELRENNASKGGQTSYHLVLADKAELVAAPQNGEGPTAITVDIYGNNAAKSPEEWIRTEPFSNYAISPDKRLSEQSVYGVKGLAYEWDGLYRGESVVVPHRDMIIMFSVTSLTNEDKIRADFEKLLSTVELN